ncbi:hypothetical protein CLIB1444_01S02168 [[Candida] jaroonii]|uniref:Uncharacterized protein n=1 Tax=[Candida] jaroonii TaxID=467808 RepID=A0ACA9Y007_9ASCO|nr:hypothetical protein CLIB1444_01S02168 [[Candida] jaroonii]
MNQTKFKKDIQKKTKLTIKNDSSNLLIYLIYVNYLNNLIENSTSNNEITMTNLIKENETLLKKFRG